MKFELTPSRLAATHSKILYNIKRIKKKFNIESQWHYYEKLIPYLKENKIDPEIYFGILIINAPNPYFFMAANVATSSTAIETFERSVENIQKVTIDLIGYVENHYIISPEEMILDALEIGEKAVAEIQEARNLSRWDALVFCVDFNMVPDLYVLACKEFSSRGKELLKLRPRVETYLYTMNDVVNGKQQDPKKAKLIASITKIRDNFYAGIKEIPKKQKQRNTGYTAIQREWNK